MSDESYFDVEGKKLEPVAEKEAKKGEEPQESYFDVGGKEKVEDELGSYVDMGGKQQTPPKDTEKKKGASSGDDEPEMDSYLRIAAPRISFSTLKREKGNRNPVEAERLSRWLYLGNESLNREIAEKALLGAPEGTFIFRRGVSEQGTYAITTVCQGLLKNYKVLKGTGTETGLLVVQESALSGGRKSFLAIHKLLEDKELRQVWHLTEMSTAFDQVQGLHYHCRGETYPGGPKRDVVPDGFVAWSIPYSGYNPVDYSDPAVDWTSPDADYDIKYGVPRRRSSLFGRSSSKELKFNKVDGKIDRTTVAGSFEIINGVPMNPFGRTGVQNRGKLLRWGPNHASTLVITRFMKDPMTGKKLTAGGKDVLDVLVTELSSEETHALPLDLHEPGEELSKTPRTLFLDPDVIIDFKLSSSEEKKLKKGLTDLFKKGTKLHKAYVDHEYNTDNAWIEATYMHYHDAKGDLLDRFEYNDPASKYVWLPVDHRVMLKVEHLAILKDLAAKMNVFF